MNISNLIKSILNIPEPELEPQIGEKWIKREVNPFNCNVVGVIDIKDDYIQYKFMNNSTALHSCSMKWFMSEYRNYG